MLAWTLVDELVHKLPLAAGAVALLVVMRRLRPRSLEGVPRREGVMEAWDLLLGFAAYAGGVVLLRGLMSLWGPAEPSQPTASERAQMGLIAQAAIQGPVALLFLWRATTARDGWREAGLTSASPWRDVLIGLAALAAAVPMVMAVGMIVTFIGTLLGVPAPDSGHEMLTVMRKAESPATLAMLLVSAILIAPVLEEIMFRGLVQTALLELLGRANRWGIVFIAAFAFTIVHASVPPQMLPALFVLGVVLGWLYERTGSLWPCFIVHIGFNAVNSALWLVMK